MFLITQRPQCKLAEGDNRLPSSDKGNNLHRATTTAWNDRTSTKASPATHITLESKCWVLLSPEGHTQQPQKHQKRQSQPQTIRNLLSVWFKSRINICVIAPRIQKNPKAAFCWHTKRAAVVQEWSSPGRTSAPSPNSSTFSWQGQAEHTHRGAQPNQASFCLAFQKKKSKINTHLSVCQNRQYCIDLSSFKVLKAFYNDSKTKEKERGELHKISTAFSTFRENKDPILSWFFFQSNYSEPCCFTSLNFQRVPNPAFSYSPKLACQSLVKPHWARLSCTKSLIKSLKHFTLQHHCELQH